MVVRAVAVILALAAALLAPAAARAEVATGVTILPASPTVEAGQTLRFGATATLDTFGARVLGQAIGIGVGDEHSCALLADGTVSCWGDNAQGQLGDGTTPPFCYVNGAPEPARFDRLWACSNGAEVGAYLTAHASPVAVSGITGATAVVAGRSHACALVGGTMRCWGANQVGQLGDGSTTPSTSPVTVSGITTATAISAGAGHTCALLADTTLRCWGTNSNGELGDGGVAVGQSATPVAVSGLTGAVAVSAGGVHTCAVRSDGTAWCWGAPGQLGDGTGARSYTPVAVSGISTATAVRSGRFHSCALLADGTVECWGENLHGQLGDGTTTNRTAPVPVTGLTGVAGLGEGWGGLHTCAVLASGALECWGANGDGQLGDATTTGRPTPDAVTGITTAESAAAGLSHTCALLDEGGSVACWGGNAGGQLGDGTATPRLTPGGVGGITVAWTSSAPAVATVDAGGAATALAAGTTLVTATSGPVAATTSLTVFSVLTVLTGGVAGIAVTSSDGRIACPGQCSATYTTSTVVTLTATRGPGSIFVGWSGDCSGTGTCTLDTSVSHSVTAAFQLHDFQLSVTVTGPGTVASSPAGIECPATCAATFPPVITSTPPLVADAVVTLTATPALGWFFAGWGGACTGTGTCSVTLDDDKTVTATFTAITLVSAALAAPSQTLLLGTQQPLTLTGAFNSGATRPLTGSPLESGDGYTCAILVDGTVQCWGFAPGTSSGVAPALVPGIRTATALGGGTSHACVVLADGTVSCWGNDFSGLSSSVPVPISGVSGATAVAAGYFSCALLANGGVTCWGQSFPGRPSLVPITGAVAISNEAAARACAVLGTGAVVCMEDPSTPVPGITDAAAVAAGPIHTCALLGSGHVKCWGVQPGDGFYGELGDGTTVDSMTPVTALGIGDAIGITVGDLHSCALLATGGVKCWGNNSLGQVGDGTTAQAVYAPVTVVEVIGGTPTPLTGVTALNAGDIRTCATIADGTARCWGNNIFGALAVGGGPTLVTEARPVVGVASALALSWSSSDPAVAVVMANGRVVARGVGTTTITATVNGGVSASLTLTVVNTPTGTGVAVEPADATGATPVTVTFSSVGTAGTTSLVTSPTGPAPPAGFQLGSPATYYDITTTAAVSGPITVCIRYAGITFAGPPRLFHFEGGAWVDRTTSVDTVTQTVCGEVSALSPFALFQPVTAPPVVTPQVSPAPGPGGWHTTTPVTVSWTVTDPSGIAASTGCDRVTLTAETPGTVLTCRATNPAGLTTSASVTVRIDRTPPTVDCRASPDVLWPPDHRMVAVTASVTVGDGLSGPAGFTVQSATSDEPDDGLGDGDRAGDVQGFVAGTGATRGSLRAERSGRGDGRVYRVTWIGADQAGNTAACTAAVRVPHSRP